jgi:hypothetical protein
MYTGTGVVLALKTTSMEIKMLACRCMEADARKCCETAFNTTDVLAFMFLIELVSLFNRMIFLTTEIVEWRLLVEHTPHHSKATKFTTTKMQVWPSTQTQRHQLLRYTIFSIQMVLTILSLTTLTLWTLLDQMGSQLVGHLQMSLLGMVGPCSLR